MRQNEFDRLLAYLYGRVVHWELVESDKEFDVRHSPKQ